MTFGIQSRRPLAAAVRLAAKKASILLFTDIFDLIDLIFEEISLLDT